MKAVNRASITKSSRAHLKKRQPEPIIKSRRSLVWIAVIILGVVIIQIAGHLLPGLVPALASFASTSKLITEILSGLLTLLSFIPMRELYRRALEGDPKRRIPWINITSGPRNPIPPSFLRELIDRHLDAEDQTEIARLCQGHWITFDGKISSARRLSRSTTVSVEKRGFIVTLNIRDPVTGSSCPYKVGDEIRVVTGFTKEVSAHQITLIRATVKRK